MTTATASRPAAPPPSPDHGLAIDLHDVQKRYRGKVHALRGIEMQVSRGEVFGLLGPNGAGKSTLVKIMMSVVYPTRAQGTVLGHPVGHKPTLRQVGYLPEHHRLPRYLTGRQVLDFYGGLAGLPRSVRRQREGELLEMVGMTDWADKKVSSYSKGMQQRIGLAQALMNDPDLIVLDEPTDGVDPVGRREIRDIVMRLKREGKTLFINSHLLSELEMVCDRVAILVQGKVAMHGTVDDLTAASRRYELVVEGGVPGWATKDSGWSVATEPDGAVKLITLQDHAAAMQPIIDRLRSEGRTIRSLRPIRENLEDLFMRAIMDPETGEALKPGAAIAPPRHAGTKPATDGGGERR